jgi:hypothetical protein
MYKRFLVRDAAILLGSALLWALVARRSAVPGIVADTTGVLAGALLGGCALLVHEWGHLLGALASRSAVRPGASLRSLFVFRFDAQRSSRAQFVAMSLGGWVGTALAASGASFLPPDDLASRVARGLTWVSVLLVVIIEVPLVTRALWTGRVPGLVDLDRKPGPSEGLA